MLVKTLIFVVGCFAATSAFSFALPILRTLDRVSKQGGSDCADFQGEWRGTCVAKSPSAPYARTVVITQLGCDSLTINDALYPIGGTARLGTATKAESSDFAVYTDWTADRQGLQVRYDGSVRSIDSRTFFLVLSGKGSFRIEDNRLVESYASSGTMRDDDASTSSPVTDSQSCTYDRVATGNR